MDSFSRDIDNLYRKAKDGSLYEQEVIQSIYTETEELLLCCHLASHANL